jgi:hypothetical protein
LEVFAVEATCPDLAADALHALILLAVFCTSSVRFLSSFQAIGWQNLPVNVANPSFPE